MESLEPCEVPPLTLEDPLEMLRCCTERPFECLAEPAPWDAVSAACTMWLGPTAEKTELAGPLALPRIMPMTRAAPAPVPMTRASKLAGSPLGDHLVVPPLCTRRTPALRSALPISITSGNVENSAVLRSRPENFLGSCCWLMTGSPPSCLWSVRFRESIRSRAPSSSRPHLVLRGPRGWTGSRSKQSRLVRSR
jgi:hypothetical protein